MVVSTLQISEINDYGVIFDDGQSMPFVDIAALVRQLAMNPHEFSGDQKRHLFEASVLIENMER